MYNNEVEDVLCTHRQIVFSIYQTAFPVYQGLN